MARSIQYFGPPNPNQSCEKVRTSLEDCEVEKDITSFILDRGTGQDIPGTLFNSIETTFVNSAQMPQNTSIFVVVMSRTTGSRKLPKTTVK